MSKFKLIADIDKMSKHQLLEAIDQIESVEMLTELKDFISEEGILTESVAEFVKSTEEFLKHGSFPLWNRLSDKEDENGDGEINDADKIGYVAKVIAGLYFYMKKDLRNSDEEAFSMVVKNLTKHNIDKNVKAQVEKNAQLKKFTDNVMANYSKPETKVTLTKHLDAIKDYYLSDLPAKVTEGSDSEYYWVVKRKTDKTLSVVTGPWAYEEEAFNDCDEWGNSNYFVVPGTKKLPIDPEAKKLAEGINNPDYAYYVVVDGKIASGWEYKEDAKDALEDQPGEGKVVAKVTLKKLGLSAEKDEDWLKG